MTNFKAFSPDQLITLSSLVSIAVSEDLNKDELATLGLFFQTMADSLALKAAQVEYLENQKELEKQLEDMQNQINSIRNQIR